MYQLKAAIGAGRRTWFPLILKCRSPDPRFLMDHMAPRVEAGQRQLDYRYVVPLRGDDGWETGDARASGFETGKIEALLQRVLKGGIRNLHGLVVIKDGKLTNA